VVTTELQGEARRVADAITTRARRLEPGDLLVYAGETTVTVVGDGRGGRNQELALAASLAIEDRPDLTLLCLGTDGVDGMSPAAGAFADAGAVRRGREAGLDAADHLRRNDTYPYLAAAGNTVECGPTGTNVGDLILVARAP
jgi:hydroxypyruvate reductase